MFHLLVRRVAEFEEAEVKEMADQCAILQANFKKLYDMLDNIAKGKIPAKGADKKIRSNLKGIADELGKLNQEAKDALNKEMQRKKKGKFFGLFK